MSLDDSAIGQTMAQVADMRVEVARLTARVDTVMSSLPVQLADHEVRLRSLERWRYGIPVGAGASIVAAFGSLAAIVYT
jgi:phospholipid N-methyltransferase